jgi:hypothetical protein
VGGLAFGHVMALGLGGAHVALAAWLARLLAVRVGEAMAEAAPDRRGRPAAPRGGPGGGWSFRGSAARRRALAQRVGAPCLLALAVAGPLPEGPTWLPWRMAAKAGAALGRAFELPTHWLLAAKDAAPLAVDGELSPVGLAFLLALVALAWAPWAGIYARLPSWRLPAWRLPAWRLPARLLPAWRLPAWRLPAWRLPAWRLPARPPAWLPPAWLPPAWLPPAWLPPAWLLPAWLPPAWLPPAWAAAQAAAALEALEALEAEEAEEAAEAAALEALEALEAAEAAALAAATPAAAWAKAPPHGAARAYAAGAWLALAAT